MLYVEVIAEPQALREQNSHVTDPAELVIAKKKSILAQSEMFPVEFKQLQSGIPIKRSCRIAGYSQFISPSGIIRSTGWTQRLAEKSFESRHPILLDSRQLLVKMFPRHLHFAHNHQHLD